MAFITFQPSDYFNTVLWSGNGSAGRNITGVGFQPDWVWVKNRSRNSNHTIVDVNRQSGTYPLSSSSSSAQDTDTNQVSALISDGFTVGSSTNTNANGENLVAWNWKAGGSGSANTDGSTNSTVSVNTTAGFSIVKWTANTSSAVTVGHGLGTAPKMIIQKAIDTSSGWIAGGFGLDWSGYMTLSGTQAFNNDSNDSSGTGRFFSAGGTEPSSTIFSTNSGALVGSATDVIAYCFAEKKGFSKFGTYAGTSNANGPFIYTGFKPAFVLGKKYFGTTGGSGAGDYWEVHDNKRNTFNPVDKRLYPNANDDEDTRDNMDFLSNGFKIRTASGEWNEADNNYLYMAFAEHPVVASNGDPGTAR